MPTRIEVPPPDTYEELRRWAKAMADLHHAVGLIVEKAEHFIPGEHVDELKAAWGKSKESFELIVQPLSSSDATKALAPTKIQQLRDVGLLDEPGALKQSTLAWLRDAFLGYFRSEPQSEEKTRL